MSTSSTTDAARLTLMLTDLRLPTIKAVWSRFADQADQEGWPAARLLATLAEHELAERARRRLERHLTDARLPPGKSLDNFDFTVVPMVSQAQVMALTSGDRWLEEGANLILFGPPGGGKSHLSAWPWWRRVIGCSTHAPPTWCSGFRWPAESSPSRPPSPSSTSTIC